MEDIYNRVKRFGNSLQSTVLLLMRLYWGTLIAYYGWHGLQDIPEGINYFKSVGLPEFCFYLTALTEIFSGLSILFGFYARLFSIPLFITMIAAYIFGHPEVLKNFFSQPSLFFQEEAFDFLLLSILIFSFGPGKYSLDYYLSRSPKEGKMPFNPGY